MNNTEQWIHDITHFSAKEGLTTPPRFNLGKNSDKTNAYASSKGITVTPDLLDAPDCVRLYLVAHELGHVAKRHYRLTAASGWALIASGLYFLADIIQRTPRNWVHSLYCSRRYSPVASIFEMNWKQIGSR
jgi:Zn-dependent protease with chaperone function